jgi:hypothetical protein
MPLVVKAPFYTTLQIIIGCTCRQKILWGCVQSLEAVPVAGNTKNYFERTSFFAILRKTMSAQNFLSLP